MNATAYQMTLVKHGPYIRGSEEWRAREDARHALGAHCVDHDPIPQGQAFGEPFAARQQINTSGYVSVVRKEIEKRKQGK